MAQEKTELTEKPVIPDKGYQEMIRQQWQEVAGYISQFGSNNCLELKVGDSGTCVKLEISDTLNRIECAMDNQRTGWSVFFEFGPERLSHLSEVVGGKSSVIDAVAPSVLTFDSEYFQKLSPAENYKHASSVVGKIKWYLEMAGFIPKR